MDDRFMKAMNSIEPDENVVERIIASEVSLFRHALMLICWGLILTSFNINIESIELALYTAWLGGVLMSLGLWMLRAENKRVMVALYCGMLRLLISAASYWLGTLPVSSDTPSLAAVYTAILIITLFTQLYCLFSGLRDLALRFENAQLASRLMRCFVLYISLYVFVLVCVAVPFLIIPVLLYGLFVLVNLPRTVNQLKKYVPLGRRATSVKSINKWVWLTLLLYIAITIGGEFGFLYYINAPTQEAQLYINAVSPETAEIRERLKDFGMPEHVLDDLPDDEVRLFEGIYDGSAGIFYSKEIVNRDGGRLEIIGFNGVMPADRIRVLFYYRWLELPKHTYTDLLSIASSYETFPISETPNERGLSLYDKEKDTYRQTLLNDGALIGFSQSTNSFILQNTTDTGLVTQIQFRLYPNYDNQRGYVAVDMTVDKNPNQLTNTNRFSTYVHQESLWNRPYFNALNKTSPSGYSQIRSTGDARAFWSEGFYTLLEYRPEQWKSEE